MTEKYEFLNKTLDEVLTQARTTDCPDLIGLGSQFVSNAKLKLNQPPVHSHTGQDNDSPLLSIQEVADRLNIPISKARELSRRKDGFPNFRIGKYIRVSSAQLREWLESLKK